MENSNNQNHFRFLLAAGLSLVVFLVWSYFFAPKPPADQGNSNTNTAVSTAATPTPATPSPTPQAEQAQALPDTSPARTVTVKTDLYEVKLDSRGALATSWILLKNTDGKNETPIYADGSTENDKKPLQLISEKALQQTPRDIPFRLITPDAALTETLNSRNYQISAAEDTINIARGEEKQIEFTMTDGAGTEVKKVFTFRGDSFIQDLAVNVSKNGTVVPDVKLLIGASIGDHAINHHNFYHIESEAVAAVDGDIRRHQGYYSFKYEGGNPARLNEEGTVDWAGVGDAYFAMVAIPARPVQGVEYSSFKYDVETQPFYDSIFKWVIRSPKTSETRHLVTAYVPIDANGSVTRIYTGTKDYFLLNSLTEPLSNTVGRSVELVDLINFSNYWFLRWMTRPLSIPILHALSFFNGLLHNYGLAIIVFTILFYSLLFPLRWSQSRSFKKAAGNAPKMKEIQDKIKELQKKGVPVDDPRMRDLQMQQLRLTKDALPIGGCLPMLLQFPLLIAFYTAVTVALDIRQASFLWLPDLSAADPWHILEFGFALSMILSMKFTPTAPAVSPEQQMQQKMMTYLMPAMMLWVMWTAPSGLLLYWFVGNVVSFAQQMIINRINRTPEPPSTTVVSSIPGGAKTVKPAVS